MGIEYLRLHPGRRGRGPLLLLVALLLAACYYSIPSSRPTSHRAVYEFTIPVEEPKAEHVTLEQQQQLIDQNHADAANEYAKAEEEAARQLANKEREKVRDIKHEAFETLRNQTTKEANTTSDAPSRTLAVVFGRQKAEPESGSWIKKVDNVTRIAEYIVDDPTAPLHLEENKGREAAVYVKYIMEHYDNLTDVTVFVHPDNKAWHNNVLLRQDLLPTLNRLNRNHVFEQGYFNTRCDLWPGCPNWILFNANATVREEHRDRALDTYSENMWRELFYAEPFPEYLSEPCCSQFAVSKEAIRAIPLDNFGRIYRWLLHNEFDMYAGRQMEYLWQYLFLGEGERCPSMRECYCKGYDLCFEDDSELERYNQARRDDDESWSGPNGVRWDLKSSAQNTMKELEASLPGTLGIDSKYANVSKSKANPKPAAVERPDDSPAEPKKPPPGDDKVASHFGK
ncbi:hypothetical protein FH972_024683 [Carpinus fangiana]|uniref:Uncharacterized protein n=1 Tax=Carpinus fangiana TaxID=176857 RepID=A0A5N6KZ13_9ROSI|nr:hypothetical protein FH972_024683 [Carpinus fangiana]